MKSRGLLFTAVLLSILVMVSPVAASHTTAVSTHTTDSDFQAASTLSNVDIQGSGDAASVTLADVTALNEGFEDNDTNIETSGYSGWYGSTKVEGTTALSGSYAGYLNPSNGGLQTARFDSDANSTASMSTLTRISFSSGKSNATYQLRGDSGIVGSVEFRKYFGSTEYQYGVVVHGSSSTTVRSWSENTNYNVEITNIDYQAETFDVVIDGTNEGTFNFTNSGNVNHFRLKAEAESGSDVYFDDVTWDAGTQESGTYVGDSHAVDDAAAGTATLDLTNAKATVAWEAWNGSAWTTVDTTTYTTSGQKSTSLPSSGYSEYRTQVDLDQTLAGGTASLDSEAVEAPAADPQFDNASASPSGGEQISSVPTYSINGSDADFDTLQGDTVTLNWYRNGTLLDTTTETTNGTWTFTPASSDAGPSQWHVEASDEYGHTTTSDTFLYKSPQELSIRDEQNPDSLVNNSGNVTVTFYNTANNETYTREADDGTVDLRGLPADSEFVVFAEVDGWYSRRIIIDSLYEQADIFLLNSSATAASVTFEIDDQTGQFPSSETKLYIERSINLSSDSSAKYRTIAGDYFGASEEFPVALEEGGRYRLIVESPEGGTRDLGAYIAEADGPVALSIGEVTFDVGGEEANYRWGTDYNANDDQSGLNATVQFTYSDPTDNTDELCLTVYNRSNDSETLTDRCYTGPYGNFSWTEELTKAQENTTWVANWSADRGNEEIGAQRVFGDNQHLLGWSMDPMWEKLLIGLLIVFVAGFFGEGMSRIGAVITASTAAGLWMMGVMPVQVSIILGALAIAVLGRMAQAGGLDSR